MAERGKAEQTERREARRSPPSPADWEDFVRQTEADIHALFGDSAEVDVRLHAADADRSVVAVDVVVAAETVHAKAEALEPLIQVSSRVNRSGADLLPEPDESVERDDAYYDEVRQAVGGGAPSVLLGTSTKSLERSLEKLGAAQQPVHDTSTSRKTFSPETRKSGPSAAHKYDWTPVRGGIRLFIRFVFVAVIVLSTLIAIRQPPPNWWSIAAAIVAFLIFVFFGLVLFVPGFRFEAKEALVRRPWVASFLARRRERRASKAKARSKEKADAKKH